MEESDDKMGEKYRQAKRKKMEDKLKRKTKYNEGEEDLKRKCKISQERKR